MSNARAKKSADTVAVEIKAAYHAMVLVDGARAAGLSPSQAVAQMKPVKAAVKPLVGKWVNGAQGDPKALAVELAGMLEAVRAVEDFDRCMADAGEKLGTPERVAACKARLDDTLLELRTWLPGQEGLSDGQIVKKVRALRSAILAIDGHAAFVAKLDIEKPPGKATLIAASKAQRDQAVAKATAGDIGGDGSWPSGGGG